LRKLSLKAEKNWHQNSGAKRHDSKRGVDIGWLLVSLIKPLHPAWANARIL
jgi:hypothetical protein